MQIAEALFGGVLIGVSSSLFLLGNGRVAGISGIFNGVLSSPPKSAFWRWLFLLGLLCGGFILRLIKPNSFLDETSSSFVVIVCAGLLVGFGTALGTGCTSGHGICGVSRLSVRSLIATLLFILSGVFTATFLKGFL